LSSACRQTWAWPAKDEGAWLNPRLLPQVRPVAAARPWPSMNANGLNLLYAGQAEAAVVASQRLLPLLRSDLRLDALLAGQWLTAVVEPAAAAGRSREPAPWLAFQQAREPALLKPADWLRGWVPPA